MLIALFQFCCSKFYGVFHYCVFLVGDFISSVLVIGVIEARSILIIHLYHGLGCKCLMSQEKVLC